MEALPLKVMDENDDETDAEEAHRVRIPVGTAPAPP